jgi:hypothetical protein
MVALSLSGVPAGVRKYTESCGVRHFGRGRCELPVGLSDITALIHGQGLATEPVSCDFSLRSYSSTYVQPHAPFQELIYVEGSHNFRENPKSFRIR